MKSFVNKAFIAGEWVTPKQSSDQVDVYDKYTMKLITSISLSSSREIELALESAELAFQKKLLGSAEKRWQLIGRFIEVLKLMRDEFIETLIAEIGKPRVLAEAEFERSIQTLELCKAQTLTFAGDVVSIDYGQGIGKMAMTTLNPVGPVLCITPFNFPLNLLMHKLGPALAVGCPVIVKPSPFAKIVNQLIAVAIERADLPKGSVSFLNVSDENASLLAKDSRIKLISFTGSASVGWKIKEENFKKKVVLELGGNAAVIVTEKCDWKKAARLIALSGNMYSGQICISTQRIFVQHDIRESFEIELINQLRKIQCGDPQLKQTMIGPIISQEQFDRIETWKTEAVSQGATLLYQGEIDRSRHILGPILLTNTTTKMKVRQQEVFGPVMTLESYSELNEAFNLVNDTRYGLQAGFFCDDIENAKDAMRELNVGAVIINGVPSFRVDSMPYGGVKDSGFGREGVLYKMKELVEPRLMII